MSRRLQIVLTCGAALVLIVFIGWRAAVSANRLAPAHGVLVVDRSLSVPEQKTCAAAAGIARRFVAAEGTRKGSTLLVLGTGDDATRGEPIELGLVEFTGQARAMAGKRGPQELHDAFVDAVAAKCRDAGQTSRSPILLAVRTASDALRDKGCGISGPCVIFVETDGLETTDTGLAAAISCDGKGKPSVQLDNAGIDVVMCGFAATTELPRKMKRGKAVQRTVESAQKLQAAWRSVFSEPQRVTIRPFCPTETTREAAGEKSIAAAKGWL